MKSAPAYAHQAVRIVLEAFEGRLFFSPTPENKKLLTFLLAHYALEYNIDLNLVLMMGDKIVLHLIDHDGRASQFIQVVFSVYVRTLNGATRSGSMVQPGSSKSVPILEAEWEMAALLHTAALPTDHITPNASEWPGLLFTPAQAGKEIELVRPEILDKSRVFPPKVTLTVAAPKFFAHLAPDVLRRKFSRKLKDLQKDRETAKRAAGTGYVGVNTALRREAGSRPPRTERRPPGRRRRPRFLGSEHVVEQAMEVLHKFWEVYYACLTALREGRTGMVWPAGTNYHHFVNGFPRITANPAPIPP